MVEVSEKHAFQELAENPARQLQPIKNLQNLAANRAS
jgi:hypothetical protein